MNVSGHCRQGMSALTVRTFGPFAMHIECPQCRNPSEIVESETAHEIACPSCGSCVITLDLQATRTYGEAPPISKVGRYELVELLGQGAFGSVWRARDPELGTERAVKLPRSGSMGSRDDEERFLREARVAANLNHPSIVTVHDSGWPRSVMDQQ